MKSCLIGLCYVLDRGSIRVLEGSTGLYRPIGLYRGSREVQFYRVLESFIEIPQEGPQHPLRPNTRDAGQAIQSQECLPLTAKSDLHHCSHFPWPVPLQVRT